MVRVAVVGLGFMGKTHLSIYNSLAEVEITALCDKSIDRVNLESLDAGGNIESSSGTVDFSSLAKFTNYEEMLEKGGFDAVDITLPTDLHHEFAVKALKAGYHTFVEKPLAMDYESSLEIAETALENGRVCSVGQCLRFWPAYTEVRKIIQNGDLGRILHAELSRYSPPPSWAADGWLSKASRSGSASFDLHIHDVDMVLFLFGKPLSVRSVGIPDKVGTFSHISTVYSFQDLSVVSSGGWKLPASYPFNMRALYIFEKGSIEMDFSAENPVMVYPEDGPEYPLILPEGDGYRHELIDFISRCESGIP